MFLVVVFLAGNVFRDCCDVRFANAECRVSRLPSRNLEPTSASNASASSATAVANTPVNEEEEKVQQNHP